MQKPAENYRTYIQFIKPDNVHDLVSNINDDRPVGSKIKLVKVEVPLRVSDDGFCDLIIPENFIMDMKPAKNAKHITWVELIFKTYIQNDNGDLEPNGVKVRTVKNGKADKERFLIDDLRLLHLEAVYRLPKKK